LSVTLTSTIETLPGGSLLTNVQMGLALGTPSGTSCNAPAAAPPFASIGVTLSLPGTLPAGTYCLQVSDVTNQAGPVAYSLAVTHY
jgi:hypothetical protein